MAINDVSLTAGMRSNLLALQDTVNLLNRTQSRLSTGKKVNSAIDNPVSFFASQALTSRASVIDSLKDAMGQAVQTITAADKGIKAITAMIEQAKGIAQSALSANPADGFATAEITFPASLTTGDTIRLGDVVFTATTSATSGTSFRFGIDGPHDAMEFMAAVNAYDWSAEPFTYAAEQNGNVVTLSKTATAGGAGANITAGDIVITVAFGGASSEIIAAPVSAELESLETQYNTLLTQLTELAEDSGYKGKNLLSDDNLIVKFEGTTLTVEGFSASAGGLGITDATWTIGGSIDADVGLLDNALITLRQESSKMSGNLSIITVRQEFSTNMINTLTEGADKLTLADTNEEGANMLMLQTRQSLSTTALSLSAQAAQSVLRLFQ